MKRLRFGTLATSTVFALVACSSSSTDGDASSSGQAGSAAGGTAGAPTNAGSSGAGAPQSGGTGNATAGASSAGSPAAGSAAVGGSAGSATGGNGGAGGASGNTASGGGVGGSGPHTVKPSAGCAKASAKVAIPNSLVDIPTSYNGKDPVPVVIAFHAAGNDNTSIQGAFKGSDLAKKYLMVYPNSTSATTTNKTGWSLQADKSRFLEVQAAILSEACVDENRFYATGHSSGAQFLAQLLCSGDGDFDAVAPVASSVYCQKWKNGAMPALIIHGVQDEERTKYNLNDGDGKKDLQPYLASNMCEMTSTPFQPDVSRCSNISGIDGKPFNAGCVEFSGCSVKTRWCNHNDPNYGTSNHGIPCFGVRAIYDFFESL